MKEIIWFFSSFFSVKYEKIKFLVIALRDSIEIYAWAPKPYHKFMAFKVRIILHYYYYFLYIGKKVSYKTYS
jgi:hypothetical protein